MDNLPLHAYFDILRTTVSSYNTVVDDEVVEENSITVTLRAHSGTPICLEDGRQLETIEFSMITKGASRSQVDGGIESSCIGMLSYSELSGQVTPRIAGQFLSHMDSLATKLLMAKANSTLTMVIRDDSRIAFEPLLWRMGRANALQIEALSFQFST